MGADTGAEGVEVEVEVELGEDEEVEVEAGVELREDEEELEPADAEAEEALRGGPTVEAEVEVIDGGIASVSKGSCLSIILKFGWRMSKMSACSIAYESLRWLSTQLSFCARQSINLALVSDTAKLTLLAWRRSSKL